MSFLLDTNGVSEYSKKKPNPKVIEWIDAQIEESLFISVLTVGEIEKGIAKITDANRKTQYELFIKNLVLRFGSRILPVSLKIARRWGNITGNLEKRGRILPIADALIAATALEHNLTIITRNTKDFADTGAKVLNIWE